MKTISGYIGKVCIILSIAFILLVSFSWTDIYIACYSKEGTNQMSWYVTGLIIVSLFLGLFGAVLEYMNDLINTIDNKINSEKEEKNKGTFRIRFYINRLFIAEANVWWMVSMAIILGIGYIWGYYEYTSLKNNGNSVIDIRMWPVMVVSLILIELIYYISYKYYINNKKEITEKKHSINVSLGSKFSASNIETPNKESENNLTTKKKTKDDRIVTIFTIVSVILWIGSIVFYRVYYSESIGLNFWKEDLIGMVWEILSTTIMMMIISFAQLKCQMKYIKNVLSKQ